MIPELILAAIVGLAPMTATAGEAETPELVKIVEAHKAAKRAGDYDRVRALQAKDARVWFEKKEGEGKPLQAGGGPWSQWDRFFNATSEVVGEWEVGDHTASARISETNDYYRLLDRPASTYRATYYFDDDNRISGLLIDGSGEERDPGRTDEFMAWAKENRPGLIEMLMPEGRMDPAPEKAKLWKQSLMEWRAEAELPPIE
jgi:hypothetical protein